MWWELALNPGAVLAYYSRPPDLVGVEVHSVALHRDGPTLELVVELPHFPDRPSPRWPAAANAVQVGLRFGGLRDVSLAGWGTANVGDLSITGTADGGVAFRLACSAARLEGVADLFDVTRITGYIRGLAEPGAVAD